MPVSWILFPHFVVHDGAPSSVTMSPFQPAGRRKGKEDTSAYVPLARLGHMAALSCKDGWEVQSFLGGAAMCLSSILENEEDSVEREVAVCHSHLSHEDHSLIYFPPVGGSWHISSATSCSFFFFFNFTFRGGKGLQRIQRGVRLAETPGATCHGLFRETAHYNLSN